MAEIGSLWAGRVFGTNTGNVFIELKTEVEPMTGVVRFADSETGVVVYEITATYNDGLLSFSGTTRHEQDGVAYGDITAQARLTSEGKLRGTWTSTLGTGGTFEAFPHDENSPYRPKLPSSAAPEQMFAKTVELGSVRLLGDDLKKIVANMSDGFDGSRPVVTFNVRGAQGTKYATEFFQDFPGLEKLTYFKAFISQLEAHGINRSIQIEFSADGGNELRVQGIHEPWVVGRASMLEANLRLYQNKLITSYKKFGVNLFNLLFLCALLIGVPEFTDWKRRTTFVALLILLQIFTLAIHSKLIPNASIQVSPGRPSFWSRIGPSVLSWTLAVTSSVAASLVFWALTREPRPEEAPPVPPTPTKQVVPAVTPAPPPVQTAAPVQAPVTGKP